MPYDGSLRLTRLPHCTLVAESSSLGSACSSISLSSGSVPLSLLRAISKLPLDASVVLMLDTSGATESMIQAKLADTVITVAISSPSPVIKSFSLTWGISWVYRSIRSLVSFFIFLPPKHSSISLFVGLIASAFLLPIPTYPTFFLKAYLSNILYSIICLAIIVHLILIIMCNLYYIIIKIC